MQAQERGHSLEQGACFSWLVTSAAKCVLAHAIPPVQKFYDLDAGVKSGHKLAYMPGRRLPSRLASFEAGAALQAVKLQSAFDNRIYLRGGLDIFYFDDLAFQLFVVLEEALDHQQSVLG